MKRFLVLVTHIIATALCSLAQDSPTDIWMMNVTLSGGKMTVTKPVSISGKNTYNDEPVFSPDGKLIFYTSHSDSLGHTEIYKYQAKTKTSALFTASPERKHAPAIMPDGKTLSFIVSEGDAHHRLWKMPLIGGTPEPLLKDKDSIGAYCWMTGDSVALQVLTSPPSLVAANISTGATKLVAQNAGRCIKRMPANVPTPGKWEDVWIFTEKSRDNVRTLKSFVYGKKGKLMVIPLCPNCDMMEGTEQFSVIRAGIFSANGPKIFIMDNGSATGWTEVADLSKYGIKNIRSLTFSPDEKKLLIVSAK